MFVTGNFNILATRARTLTHSTIFDILTRHSKSKQNYLLIIRNCDIMLWKSFQINDRRIFVLFVMWVCFSRSPKKKKHKYKKRGRGWKANIWTVLCRREQCRLGMHGRSKSARTRAADEVTCGASTSTVSHVYFYVLFSDSSKIAWHQEDRQIKWIR